MAVGDLVVNLTARTERFTRGINTARKSLGSFVSSAVSGIASVGAQITKMGATAAVSLGGMAVKLAADAEQTAVSFEVLTGSAEQAQKLISDLRTMGASTPFQVTDLNAATKTLLNFGVETQGVMKDIDMLSNVAAGDGQKLQSLALVFGQISANGRLTGQDLLQLVNAGFNPLQNIAEKTGESMRDLRDRMSRGEIGFDEVRDAFRDATSEGGRFYKMNERQSQTLLGRWSTLKDNVTAALMEIGTAIIKEFDLKQITADVTEMTKTFKKDWVPVIVDGLKMAAEFGQKMVKVFNNIQAVVEEATVRVVAFKDGLSVETVRKQLEDGRAVKAFTQEVDVELGEADDLMKKIDGTNVKKFGEDSLHNTDHLFSNDGFKIKFDDAEMAETRRRYDAMTDEQKAAAREEIPKFVAELQAKTEKNAMPDDREVRSLEQGSQEAFEVLRASQKAGGKDVPKQQLNEAKKQTKELLAIKKAMVKPPDTRKIEVSDIF